MSVNIDAKEITDQPIITHNFDVVNGTCSICYYAEWILNRKDYLDCFEQKYDFGEDVDMEEKSLHVKMGALPHKNGVTINMYWKCDETEQKGCIHSFTHTCSLAVATSNWEVKWLINNEENDIVEFEVVNIADLELPEVMENHIFKEKEKYLEENCKTQLVPIKEENEEEPTVCKWIDENGNPCEQLVS